MALPTRVQRAMQDPLDALPREFGTLMNRFLSDRDFFGNSGTLAPYGVDVREDADHLYVEAELPGFKKEEIDITLENATLTITALKKDDEEKKGDWLLRERRYTRYSRSFTLPPTVNENSVDAKLADGVLTITLNKREESKPRKISVS